MTPNKKAARLGTGAASNTTSSPHSTTTTGGGGVDALLSRLEGVKRTGPDSWMARCPAHEDRSASLSIRALDDGRVLVHCFAGCSAHEVVGAVGMELSDLMPPRAPTHGQPFKPERRRFPAADALRGIALEGLVIAHAGVSLLDGLPFTDADRERLITAVARVQSALTASGVHHG